MKASVTNLFPPEPGPRPPLRGGFFLVELLVGVLILSLALIPMYQMFVTSSRTMFYSKLSYMAMHAAREELEELRQLPFPRVLTGELSHDWTPVAGRMLVRTLKYRPGDGSALSSAVTSATSASAPASIPASGPTSASPFDADEYDYPKEYQRIETKLELSEVDPPNPKMRKAVLMVRWQETGESPQKVGDVGQRVALSRFETILVSHDADLQP